MSRKLPYEKNKIYSYKEQEETRQKRELLETKIEEWEELEETRQKRELLETKVEESEPPIPTAFAPIEVAKETFLIEYKDYFSTIDRDVLNVIFSFLDLKYRVNLIVSKFFRRLIYSIPLDLYSTKLETYKIKAL